MSDIALPAPAGFSSQRAALSFLASGLLMFGVFLSGFVIDEPAPYELYMAALIGGWSLCGLRLSRRVMILLALFVLLDVGGLLALTTMADFGKAPLYMAVSGFLGLSSVFFAAVIEADHRRLRIIYRGYLAGALITALLGIVGYFHLVPNGEIFTRYGRAMGAFQDPNVFGPYLVLPAVYLVHGLLVGRVSGAIFRLAALLVLALGVFLSFSRAAWALFAFSVVMVPFFLLLKERSTVFRLRILVLALVGILVVVVGLLVALQIPQVSHLFSTRAHLEQSYDTAEFGRFERHKLGFLMAMTKPLGIGPLSFGRIYGEDPHNIWLKTLMAYGWLGFVSYVALIVCTLCFGFRLLLRDRPWQPYALTAYIVLTGHVLIGDVIDTDHWRHFYLLVGIVWGCCALEARYCKDISHNTSTARKTWAAPPSRHARSHPSA